MAAIAVIAFSMAVVLGGFVLVNRNITEMRTTAKEHIFWAAVQLEIELMRFDRELDRFANGDPGVSRDTVQRRFDILWSRVRLFDEGSVGARLRAYDRREGRVERLFADLRASEPEVQKLQNGDRDRVRLLRDRFARHMPGLHALSIAVSQGGEERAAKARRRLAGSSRLLTAGTAAAIIASLAVVFIYARESARFRRIATENRRLLEESDRASREKSRFLAMISHELRTPLNAVLGLLALVRQHGLGARQGELVDQAELSGRQMIGLLGDALDFASLADGELALELAPFDPRELAERIGEDFAPIAARQGLAFSARVARDCPDRLVGDAPRIGRAVSQFLTHAAQTSGSQGVALGIGYDHAEAALQITITFGCDSRQGEWSTDRMMGRPPKRGEAMAIEALGPAVARDLIARMGGATRSDTTAADGTTVRLSVPARSHVMGARSVRLVCRSAALETICRAALRDDRLRLVAEGDSRLPDVVLIEAGSEDEAAIVAAQRQRHPHACLVALGAPEDAGLFAAEVKLPIDVAEIQRTVLSSDATPAAGENGVAPRRGLRRDSTRKREGP